MIYNTINLTEDPTVTLITYLLEKSSMLWNNAGWQPAANETSLSETKIGLIC
jgi:hypothetical protein